MTEKEKAILIKKHVLPSECPDVYNSSPKPPPGIVQSMRKFYSDNIADKVLNRSNSFSAAIESNMGCGQEDKENMLNIEVETSPTSDASVSSNSDTSDSKKPGAFRLFRSRSWSLRRKTNKDVGPIVVGPIKRCSPSYSTKSADSGFSDSQPRSSVSSQETQEEELASLAGSPTNSVGPSEPVDHSARNNFLSKKPASVSADAGLPRKMSDIETDTPTAKSKVSNTLGNIASMQEGLRIKRQQLEESGHGAPLLGGSRQSSTNILIRAQDEDEKNKISKQFYFSEIRR